MAADFGFVYLLGHPNMPNIFKIGFTDRSPHLRARELSNSTSVPAPFEVLCYFEAEDALGVERALHSAWSNFRVSTNREFFEVKPERWEQLASYFIWHPARLAFTDVSLWTIGVYDTSDVENPWAPEVPEPEPQPEPAADLKVVGGTEAPEMGQCQAA
jgi:T5orf172 domain-containing protein